MTTKRRFSSPVVDLPIPPAGIDDAVREYLDRLRFAMAQHIQRANTPGIFPVHEIDLVEPPTGGFGLPVGAVYVDSTATLKMKRSGEAWVPRISGTMRLGKAAAE